MSPIEVLRTATFLAAARLGNKSLGRLAAGCVADLIAVKGDPTRAVADSPEVSLVVRAGEVLKPAELRVEARRALQEAGRDPWESEFPRPASIV